MVTEFLSLLTTQVDNLDTPGTITAAITALSAAFHSGAWAMVAGIVLMALVYIAKKFDVVDRLPSAMIPIGTIVIAVLSSIGLGLQSGQSIGVILTTGLTVGLAAIGAWETAGQHVAAAIEAPKVVPIVEAKPIDPPKV